MKIKNRKAAAKTLPINQKDRMNLFIVIGIILLVDLLIYFTAFPMIEDIAAGGPNSGSAEGAFFLKATSIIATDIFIFVTLSMILSRRKKR